METFEKQDLITIFSHLHEMAAAQRDHLIELDSVMGDGDLGLTMLAVFSAADQFVSTSEEDDLGTLLMKTGMVMAKAAPSTMGTLMATGFMRGGKAVKGATSLDRPAIAAFFTAFTEGIMDRGKSKPGEKTIIDALHPAAAALEQEHESLAQALAAARSAAYEGLEATKDMVAQHGRAAYYQERSRTTQDPGATIGALVVEVFAAYAAQ
ncbi:MAG: dihydroxyacetone kinase subunit L [Spirochaetia bacterium]|nr:dihydroxyacetone kinase subunit L [Spirochaetia bacterium]